MRLYEMKLYEEPCPLEETEDERKVLEAEIRNLRWKKNNRKLTKISEKEEEVLGRRLYQMETLLILCEKEVFYPPIDQREFEILNSYYAIQYPLPGSLIFSVEALEPMPAEVQSAYENAFMLGFFSSFMLGSHLKPRENILLGFRKGEDKASSFLIARWGSKFGSWEDMIRHWADRQDAGKSAPLAGPFFSGAAAGMLVVTGISLLFVPFPVALANGFLGILGGWLVSFLWYFYGRKRHLQRTIPSPF